MWSQERELTADDEPTTPGREIPRARVLIVEDDPRFRSIVARRLGRDGYDVYLAATGDEAMSMLRLVSEAGWPTDGFELVLLDHHLPGSSGIDVLRQLRAAHAMTPALLMTAFPEPRLVEQAVACGAGVLAKPFTLDQLCDVAIQAILAHRRTARIGGVV